MEDLFIGGWGTQARLLNDQDTALFRQGLAQAWSKVQIMKVNGWRTLSSTLHGTKDFGVAALGATLLMERRYADAESVYREELHRNPSNGWSLRRLGLIVSDESQPVGHAQHMAVDGQARHTEGVAQHHVGGLAADPGQGDQVLEPARHLAVVLLDQSR